MKPPPEFTAVPAFKAGEIDGVREYLTVAIPDFSRRIGLTAEDESELVRLVYASFDACRLKIAGWLKEGYTPILPEGRALIEFLFERLVSQESTLAGGNHLEEAIAASREGANILIVQNHRSGMDTGVFETLIWRNYGKGFALPWSYMSGHIVNHFMVPLLFTASLNRYQIVSIRYQAVLGMPPAECRAQNTRAMTAIRRSVKNGGKVIGLYPEGGRGDIGMKRGEAQTACIAQLIARTPGKKGFFVLPTYVDGAPNLLPPRRGENEYNEIFANLRRGTAHVRIGSMIPWEQIETEGADHQRLVDRMLAPVAALAPDEVSMGPYAPGGEGFSNL